MSADDDRRAAGQDGEDARARAASKSPQKAEPSEKTDRLAAALRANLLKRKAQIRARASDEPDC